MVKTRIRLVPAYVSFHLLRTSCPMRLCARSTSAGIPRCGRALFDDIIGARGQTWRHVETKSLRGFQIDDELEMRAT
jgi:hypothetical protein